MLDPECRQQQVNDGCFDAIESVPTHAVTLAVPAIMRSDYRICVVPGQRKRDAVSRAVTGPIGEACPATVLRTKESNLFLDNQSGAALIKGA